MALRANGWLTIAAQRDLEAETAPLRMVRAREGNKRIIDRAVSAGAAADWVMTLDADHPKPSRATHQGFPVFTASCSQIHSQLRPVCDRLLAVARRIPAQNLRMANPAVFKCSGGDHGVKQLMGPRTGVFGGDGGIPT